MLDVLEKAAGHRLEHGVIAAHRWRYAQPSSFIPVACAYDTELRIGVCGDAFGGSEETPPAEAAWRSGRAMAHELMSTL